ncbi:MAG: helix-turn-helix domain-containing protein [Maricaulaceae bacterium]|nr:helix-turn-helix domain-containing protein [Maricaulaceae bacterium]
MLHVPVIRNEDDLTAALREIDRLWGAEPETEDGDRLEALITLVTAYEDKHHPVPDAEPADVLAFVMEQRGLTQADLARLLGSRSRASEILNRKRGLTLEQIRRISREWRIPPGSLIGPLEAA